MGVISSLGDAPGVPVIDKSKCTVCESCAKACPTGVLSKQGDGIQVNNSVAFGCIACGHCMMVCPSGGISVSGRKLSPADIVDLPPQEQRPTLEQIESLFLSRRSVRHFKNDEVSGHLLDRVVAAAAMAPMGIPPWEIGIVVFDGREKVRELARDTANTYEGLLKFMDNSVVMPLMRPFMKKATYDQFKTFILPLGRKIVEGRNAGEDWVLYNAPAALLFHNSPYADAADATIACTHAMIAAESLGLGTCMIGCLSPAVARRKDLLKKYGIPDGHKPAIVLILGYPAIKFRKAIHRPFFSVKRYA
jgi:nitroreductase/NAD-dependent dihydropyrimidine dehydrogenase PreA subunit